MVVHSQRGSFRAINLCDCRIVLLFCLQEASRLMASSPWTLVCKMQISHGACDRVQRYHFSCLTRVSKANGDSPDKMDLTELLLCHQWWSSSGDHGGEWEIETLRFPVWVEHTDWELDKFGHSWWRRGGYEVQMSFSRRLWRERGWSCIYIIILQEVDCIYGFTTPISINWSSGCIRK